MTFDKKWDLRFLNIAKEVSSWSKDPSTKVGAVIVSKDKRILSTGYNGFPSRIKDHSYRLGDRKTKLLYTEHAERNAISNAAKSGIVLKDSILYITKCPCMSCLMGILSSGISEIVYIQDTEFEKRWIDNEIFSLVISESGLLLKVYSNV